MMTDSKYTGVIFAGDSPTLDWLKPFLSVFDRIAVMEVSGIPEPDPKGFRPFSVFHKIHYEKLNLPESLLKSGLLLPVDFEVEQEYGNYLKVPEHVEEFLFHVLDPSDVNEYFYSSPKIDVMKVFAQIVLNLKIGAMYLQYLKNIQAVPIIDFSQPNFVDYSGKKLQVLEIIIGDFAIFEESVPWEAIIEFSLDKEAQENKLALRRWITKICKENYSDNEIKDELKYLMNQRQKHLDYHRAKYKKAISETWIKLPLTMTEDLLKARLGKLVDNFFHVRHLRSALLEAELNAPYPEIAHCLKMENALIKTKA